MSVDERIFQFLDAVLAKDWGKAKRIALDLEQGEQIDLFGEIAGECRTCKRNADNGGIYEDGRTKCPIQEHYALLLDGYCHLYEQI